MFIVQKNEIQKEKLEKLLKRVKIIYGVVPPQMEFLGNIEVAYLEDFLKMVMRVMKHPNIELDLFGFIRLHIAFKEDYIYCKMFNTQLLLSKGYSQDQLDVVISDISAVPLDAKHQALATFAVKVIYESKICTQDDFDKLYEMNWSQKDVFDVVEHAGSILKNGRILMAYTVKE
jgi:hypothetical protein